MILSLPGKVSRMLVCSKACRAIQNAFSKPSLENLISNDANLVLHLSVRPLVFSSKSAIINLIICLKSIHLHRRHSKKVQSHVDMMKIHAVR